MLFAACKGQSTTKYGSNQAGSRSSTDQAIHEELKILKDELFRTNAKLQTMEKSQQFQHGRVLETPPLNVYNYLHQVGINFIIMSLFDHLSVCLLVC